MDRYFADLSNNNTQAIDWPVYHKAGHVLVGLKASEGEHFVDQTHALRSEGAHKAGVWVLHYHFAHVGSSASQQAQFFWSQIKGHLAQHDYACIDVEQGGLDGKSAPDAATWTRSFDVEFKRVSGHSLVLYSDESFLSELTAAGGGVAGDRAWIAAYGPQKPSVAKVSTWGWQFTDGDNGPEPHQCAGVGKSDVSELNLESYLHLRATKPKI